MPEEEVEEIELDDAQLKLVEEKKEYARQNMKKVLNDDYVIRICVDNDFDSVKIDKILDTFKTDVRV